MKRLLQTNLRAAAENLWLVTVTAPGQSVLPCAHDTCGHKGPHAQRSWDGCRVDPTAADLWNRTASRRWRELNRKAGQTVRRRLALGSPVIAGVWQLQQRGVLHLHLLLAVDSDDDKRAAKLYVSELRRLGPAHHFGFIDARDRDGKAGRSGVMAAARAAGYVSSYLSGGGQFTAALARHQRPRRLVYVAARITRETFVTMRRLRRARHLFCARRRLCAAPAWARSDVRELLRVSLVLDRSSVVPAGP